MEGLEYLEMHLSDICNLKCKGCSHFSNITKCSEIESVQDFKKHMKRLSQVIPVIYKIRLLGGEPLLNERAAEYVISVREHYPYTDISVVTNGLLLLKQDESLFAVLRKYNIGVDISLYPPTMKILDKIEEHLKLRNVNYTLTSPIRTFRRRMNKKGISNPVESHQNCVSRHCHFYANGFVAACPAPMVIKYLVSEYGFDYEPNEDDVLSIDNSDLDANKLIDFLNQPMDICRYCSEPEDFEWSCKEKVALDDWFVK